MSSIVSVSTNHADVIHDSQFDYYGQLLATCSSDRTVKIFSVNRGDDSPPTLEANLIGHEGPVWMVAWAHPRFGQIIASCSYDNRTIIWTNRGSRTQQGQQHQWRPVHVVNSSASVNGICWSPHEFGLSLASANSDGTVSVTSFADGVWRDAVKVGTAAVAHPMGAMSVSFLPCLVGVQESVLASAGCDGCVRIWRCVNGQWISAGLFNEHSDWARDVCFAPTGHAAPYIYLASCAQDRKVIVRRKKISDVVALLADPSADISSSWEVSVTTLPSGVWRLSWSSCGTTLLATTSDSEALLLTQGKDFTDSWNVSSVDESK